MKSARSQDDAEIAPGIGNSLISTRSTDDGARKNDHPLVTAKPAGRDELAAVSGTGSTALSQLAIAGEAQYVRRVEGGAANSNVGAVKQKRTKFPEKLMLILDNSGTQEAISWSDDGKSWRVNSAKKLEEILPTYFKHSSYRSFLRQANIYSFKRVVTRTGDPATSSGEAGYYHHPVSCYYAFNFKLHRFHQYLNSGYRPLQ